MSKPCGTGFGHDDCGYIYKMGGDMVMTVPEVRKPETDKSKENTAKYMKAAKEQ